MSLPNQVAFFENNQVTAFSPDKQFSHYPDNIHKLDHRDQGLDGQGLERRFLIPDSLRTDTDLVLNYFCN